MDERLETRVRFDFIRYANVWEDTEILCAALRPADGIRILSIASGGDNAIALAASGAHVVAVDLSPAQLCCMRLKCAAIKHLSYDELLCFLGVHDSPDRRKAFLELSRELPDDDREFWRSNYKAIDRGLLHAGKFEKYFHVFRRFVVPLIHSKRIVNKLLEEKPYSERVRFYRDEWDCYRWRLLFRFFSGRFVLGGLGRNPEFFRFVQGPVADKILDRIRYGLTEIPTHDNRYLDYVAHGNFRQRLPWYLEAKHLDRVREGLSRLVFCCSSVEEAAARHAEQGFDGFNLSDIFEYLSPEASRTVYGQLLNHARPGARFAYWNMLAPRELGPAFPDRVSARSVEADELFRQNRAFFYSAFVVEETKP